MKKILFIIPLLIFINACSGESKPPLESTQIVDGKSIVMPPEFYVLPKASTPAKAPEGTAASDNNQSK